MSAWKNRQTNSNIITFNVPSAAIEEALVSRKGKLLNMGDNLLSELRKTKGFAKFVIPANTYRLQYKDAVTAALHLVIFTRENIPEDVVYYMTEAIYENKEYMATVHSSFKGFDPKSMVEGLGIEMHKGASKFYKEIGLLK